MYYEKYIANVIHYAPNILGHSGAGVLRPCRAILCGFAGLVWVVIYIRYLNRGRLGVKLPTRSILAFS